MARETFSQLRKQGRYDCILLDEDGADMQKDPPPPTPEQRIAVLSQQVDGLSAQVSSLLCERERLCDSLFEAKTRANRAEPYMWAVLYIKTAVILLAMLGAAVSLFIYGTVAPAALVTAAVLCWEGWYQWRARNKRPG